VLAPGNNEAAGALQLVELLQLMGCVVTADALHCHRGMAKAIVGRGGDYVLAVKNNQPGLLRDAKAAISAAERKKAKQATTNDADHGRKETRTAIVTLVKDMAENHDFPGLKAVARITSKRGRDKTVHRCFLTRRHNRCASFANIGVSKTFCTGRSTSFSTRIRRGAEKTMPHQPRRSAATCPQYCPRSSRHKDLVARQTQTCRMGRQFPRGYALEHAIALP
jgi:predicted transposase YbfD/YdcC